MPTHSLRPAGHHSVCLPRWSEYGAGIYDGSNDLVGCGEAVSYFADDDEDNNNNDGDDNTNYYYNNQESPSKWYLGATQCFRPNVAYTLYGVRTGTSLPGGRSPCSEKQYIDSFFTKYGIESFGDGLGIDYESYGASSYCHSGDYDYGNSNYMYYNMYSNGQAINPDAYSYGTGCSADGFFELVTFSGLYCNGQGVTKTTNQLYLFNSNLEALGCLKVYDAAASNNANTDDAAAAAAYDDTNQSEGDVSAEYLLSRSVVCSISEYPERCPDPYGIKAKRDATLYHKARSHSRAVPLFMPIATAVMCIGSALLYLLTFRQRPNQPRSRLGSMASSFDRAASFLAIRTASFKEKLLKYAEEMEEEDVLTVNVKSYEYIPTRTSGVSVGGGATAISTGGSNTQDEGEARVNAVKFNVNEKESVSPSAKDSGPTQKYKRPIFARVTKGIFRRRKTPGAAETPPMSPASKCSEPPPTPKEG